MLRPLAAAACLAAAPAAAHALAVGDAFSEIAVTISSATTGTGAVYLYSGDAAFDDDAVGLAASFANAAHVPAAISPGTFDDLIGGDPILDVLSLASITAGPGGAAEANATASAFILIDNPSQTELVVDVAFEFNIFALADADDPTLETALAASTLVLETFDPVSSEEVILFSETFFADTDGVFGPGAGDSGSLSASFTVAPGTALNLVTFVGASAFGSADVPVPAALPLLTLGIASIAALRRRS